MMTIRTRVWDGVELINGIDVNNHPHRKEEIQRIKESGGHFVIGEEQDADGFWNIVMFQDTCVGGGGLITSDRLDSQKNKLKSHMEEAKAQREKPAEDDEPTKKIKALLNIVQEQALQISTLKSAVEEQSKHVKDLKDVVFEQSVQVESLKTSIEKSVNKP
jgi:hypothetical protein